MVGTPGSGKTHFAEQFSETFSAPFISDQLFQAIARDPEEGNLATFQILSEILKSKHTVLFEGPLDRRVDRTDFMHFAKEHGYKTLFVWVQTDPVIAKTRALKHMSEDTYDQRVKIFSPPHESEPYIVISGRHTHSTQARTLLQHLSQSQQQRPIPKAPVTRTGTSTVDRRLRAG